MENVLCVELMHLNVRRIVCEGDPAETITEQACHGRSDLIMMPTHGYGPFRRLLLGSVTSKVLHDTPCAVWTGAHVEQGPSADRLNFNNVACAVDLGAHGPRVLRWAANLASEFNSRLTSIHLENCIMGTSAAAR